MTSAKKRDLVGLFAALAVFAISRLAYDRAGVQFETAYIFGWQAIDPLLLRTDLWRSLFYLHTQPPLWNLFLGLGLRAFPDPQVFNEVFNALYYALAASLVVLLYWLGLYLGLPRGWAAAAAALFIVSPAAALYENSFSYAYPLVAWLALAALFLYQFALTRRALWGALFFCALTGVALLWSFFHLVWVLGAAAFLLFAWDEKKKVLLAALPVLTLVAWYGKNAVLVGDFAASTWGGMNLSRVATFRYPEAERKRLVKQGYLSPFALIPPFRNAKVYLKLLPRTPATGIPVLDNAETSLGTRNQHHLVYAEAGRYYLKDALRLIVREPGVYARSLLQSAYIYFHSATDYEFVEGNLKRLAAFDRFWNRAFYWQMQSGETAGERLNRLSAAHFGWGILAAFALALGGGIDFLRAARARLREPRSLLVLFMVYNILYATAVGIAMEIGENNRFRFTIDPFILLLMFFTARRLFAFWRGRLTSSQAGE